MIDIIPKHLFMEKDILHMEYGPYKQGGVERFAVAVELRGRQKPVIGIYDSYIDMTSAVSRIEEKWKAAEGQTSEGSMMEIFRKMQERMNETEKKLAEWEKTSVKEEKHSGRKGKTTGKKAAEKISAEEAELLLERAGLPEAVVSALKLWVRYKNEKNEKYTATGLKGLITKAARSADKFGPVPVADLIDDSIASNYKGIIWDRLGKRETKKNQFTQFRQNEYDFEGLEDELAGLSEGGTGDGQKEEAQQEQDRWADSEAPEQTEGFPA